MTTHCRFLVSQALAIFAFAYAARGYHTAAIFTAVCAVLYSIYENGFDAIRKDFLVLVPIGILEGLLIHSAGYADQIPSLASVSCAALLCADLWMAEKWQALRKDAILTAKIFLAFLLLTLLVPEPVWGVGGTLMLVGMLFLPYLCLYLLCALLEGPVSNRTLKARAGVR